MAWHRPPPLLKGPPVNLDRVFTVAGAIVTLATVTTIVSNSNSAAVIRAFGDAFSGSIRAAMGR